jgi:hypothetical protein
MTRKHKWGDIRESDERVFWGYHKNRVNPKNPTQIYEEWISRESFEERRKKLKRYTKEYGKRPEIIKQKKIKNKNYYSKEENRQKRRDWWAKYSKERKARDHQYATGLRVRTRICMALKNKRVKKSLRTVELIGCSYEFLRNHIESQFRDGMCWNKKHSFHIDHIRPLSSFDLTDQEQLKAACHWSNLQPLYPEENIKKGSKVIEESFDSCKNTPNDTASLRRRS